MKARAWLGIAAPLAAALALLAFLSWKYVSGSVARNGAFTYTLDDAYIHLAIAKNLALHGVWGVTRHAFASASSSPLWTLLLAGANLVVGVRDLTPLVLALLFGALLLVQAADTARRHGLHPLAATALLALLVYAVPLVPVAMTGMEHTLHAALSLAFAALAARTIAEEAPTTRRWILLGVLGALVVAVRYEGAFLVGAAWLPLLARHGITRPTAVLAAGAAPAVLFGLYNVAHGWPFLPTSVLVKARPPGLDPDVMQAFLLHVFAKFAGYAGVVILVGAAALLLAFALRPGKPWWEERTMLLLMYVVAGVGHLLFAEMGWFHRYEAYLVAMGLVVVALGVQGLLREHPPTRRDALRYAAVAVALMVLVQPLSWRAREAHRQTVDATENIHQQQRQMARFVATYHDLDTVVLNDIGAVSYYTDSPIVDLWGLASEEMAQARVEGTVDAALIERLSREADAKVVLIYEPFFIGYGLPAEWVKVGEWTIERGVVVPWPTVSVYAATREDAPAVREQFREFRETLPERVDAYVIEADP